MSDSHDAEYLEHVTTWQGFTRLIIGGTATVVVVLIGMAVVLL